MTNSVPIIPSRQLTDPLQLHAFTYTGGAIVYRSKAQSIVALSSTEAELIEAVTAANTSIQDIPDI